MSAQSIERGKLSLAELFDEDMLGDDLEAWLAESALMKRTFRNNAIIAGLIAAPQPPARRRPAARSRSRPISSMTYCASTSQIICCCGRRVPMLQQVCSISSGSAKCSPGSGVESSIRRLEHVSPLAVPVMLEIGRETVYGEASDALLAETADELVKEAMS